MNKETIPDLVDRIYGRVGYDDVTHIITEWVEAQNRTRAEIARRTIDQLSSELVRCHKLLRAAETKPNWEQAPKGAATYRIEAHYLDTHGYPLREGRTTLYEENRPECETPNPDDTWKHLKTGNDYYIEAVITLPGQTKMPDGTWEQDLQLVSYRPIKADGNRLYRRQLNDFTAKFAKVNQ